MTIRLMKLSIASIFAGSFKRYTKQKKMKPHVIALIGLLVVYCFGALMVAIGSMFYSMCAPFFDAGIGWLYFAIAGVLVFFLCFIGSVFMAQSQIFNARDNELLLSMPIKPSAILGGRILALLAFEYIYEAIVVIPVFAALVMTGYVSRIPPLGIAMFFIAFIMLPLLSLAVGCLIGWGVALITSRMRRKNIITLVLSLGFLAGYLWGYTKLMSNLGALVESGTQIAEAVRRAVFPAYHLGVAIESGSMRSFLFYALCAAVPFLVMYWGLSVSFVKLATAGNRAKKARYREKSARASGARAALLKRELRSFASQPMYILNSSLGAMVALILAVVLIAAPDVLLGAFDSQTGYLAGFLDPGILGVLALTALSMMNNVSAPSISLEGKRLWIVKSLPVRTSDILFAKVLLHAAVCGIPGLVAGIACIIAIPMNALQAALTIISPAAATLMLAMLGVAINLAFPRFDWMNPIQPVKQGASAMISMFGGMALIIVLATVFGLLSYRLPGAVSIELFIAACTVLFAAACGALYSYLRKGGSRKFEKLQ